MQLIYTLVISIIHKTMNFNNEIYLFIYYLETPVAIKINLYIIVFKVL